MTQLPAPLQPGQTTLNAGNWSFLIEEVRKTAKHVASQVLNASGFSANAPRERTVVITKTPSESDTTLTVSPVSYSLTPPQQCEGEADSQECFYELSTEQLEVYPDFGWRAIDYLDAVFAGGTLDNTTTFLRMYFEAGTWRLQRRDSDVAWRLAVPFPIQLDASGAEQPDTHDMIKVVVVKIASDGVLETDGNPFDVDVWPGMLLRDYKPIYSLVGFDLQGPVIRLDRHGSKWYARQVMPWAGNSPSGRAVSSCQAGST